MDPDTWVEPEESAETRLREDAAGVLAARVERCLRVLARGEADRGVVAGALLINVARLVMLDAPPGQVRADTVQGLCEFLIELVTDAAGPPDLRVVDTGDAAGSARASASVSTVVQVLSMVGAEAYLVEQDARAVVARFRADLGAIPILTGVARAVRPLLSAMPFDARAVVVYAFAEFLLGSEKQQLFYAPEEVKSA